jgi:uncharacterized membrane protein
MDLIKQIISLVFYIEQDKSHAKPYWLDPTVIALVVSLLATALARWAGMDIDADLQLKIVGSITGIGALLSPHTGVIKKRGSEEQGAGSGNEKAEARSEKQGAGSGKDDSHNLGSLS